MMETKKDKLKNIYIFKTFIKDFISFRQIKEN